MTRADVGYTFGVEWVLTFNYLAPSPVGRTYYGGLLFNCDPRSVGPSGNLSMSLPPPGNRCVQIAVVESGRWYNIEAHVKLNGVGQADGVFEAWVDDCGESGVCKGTPTSRVSLMNVRYPRYVMSDLINSLWWESWSNPNYPNSQGVRLIDQIKVSKVGPIGFVPARSTTPSPPSSITVH
jgi:hypothetical protein